MCVCATLSLPRSRPPTPPRPASKREQFVCLLACLIPGPTRLRANRTRLPPSRGVPALAPCWRIRPHGGPPMCRWWHQLSGWCSGGMCPRRGCHLPSAGPAPPLGRGLWARALRPGAPPPKGWGRPHLIPRRRTPVSISAVGVYVAIPRPRPRTHSSATDISSPLFGPLFVC